MFDFFNIEISKLFKQSEEEMLELHHPYVGTEHLLLALLKMSHKVQKIAQEFDFNYEIFKDELQIVVGRATKKSSYILYTPLLKKVIKGAIDQAKRHNEELNYEHLFRSLLEEGEGIAIRVLIGMDIDIDQMYERINNAKIKSNPKLELLEIGKNLNSLVNMDEKLIGREKEINYMIETLIRKDKNNPLLIGPAGVGKTALVEELARLINLKKVPQSLENKKIILLEMGSLVAGTKYRGEFEERLTKIIKELEKNPDYIIFIDEIHSMVNAGGAEGAINAADILKPYLARGAIKCIGATTTAEYNKFIAGDKALARRFETINVLEPDEDETKNILIKVKSNYEKHYGITIKNQDIERIVTLANKYLYDKKNPDKALDVLDSVCAYMALKRENEKKQDDYKEKLEDLKKKKEELIKANNFEEAINVYQEEEKINLKIKRGVNNKYQSIKDEDIYYVISKKVSIPTPKEKEKLLTYLKTELDTKVYGQADALLKINKTLKEKFFTNNLPISFLFNGASGVGKSYVAIIMAKCLKMKVLKLDFSEYANQYNLSKLLGTNAGYVGYEDEALINTIKYNPYSMVIIENYEDGCKEIKKLLAQILENGLIKNGKGEDISFKNTIIVINMQVNKNRKVGFNLEKINNYSDNNLNSLKEKVDELVEFALINKETMLKYLESKNYDKEILNNINYANEGFKIVLKELKNA